MPDLSILGRALFEATAYQMAARFERVRPRGVVAEKKRIAAILGPDGWNDAVELQLAEEFVELTEAAQLHLEVREDAEREVEEVKVELQEAQERAEELEGERDAAMEKLGEFEEKVPPDILDLARELLLEMDRGHDDSAALAVEYLRLGVRQIDGDANSPLNAPRLV